MKKTLPQKQYIFIFYTLLLLLIVDRLLHLYLFSFQYADSDQTIMWLGAVEMLQGHFHEPAFYGQAYNTFFEGFLALPLLAIGLPVYVALPIVTTGLAIFPFLLFAFLSKNHNKIAALIFLAIPLILPVEYDLLTQLPRGFIGGVFSASIAVAFLVFNNQIKTKHLLLSGFFGGFALVLNPNSVLLLFTIYLYILIVEKRKLRVVINLFLGVIPAILWQAYVLWFYANHPDYIVHTFENKGGSFTDFLVAIKHLHELFYGLFPFLIFLGVAILPTLLFLAYRLNKKGNKAFSITLLLTVVFVIGTFFLAKIGDGTSSIFFPYSRMFLALPIVAVLALYYLFKGTALSPKPMFWFLGIVGVAVTIKFLSINDRVGWNLHNNSGYVKVFKINEFETQYKQVQHIADSLNIDLLVIKEKNDALNYGVMALSNSRLKTINLSYERKNWLLVQLLKANNKPFLYWCANKEKAKQEGLTIKRVSEKFPLYKAQTPYNPMQFFLNAKSTEQLQTQNP